MQVCLLLFILFALSLIRMISWNLPWTWQLFNQVISLSTTPLSSFSVGGWNSLISLLMSLLTNPFFYGVIGVIIIMGILPTVEDE